MVFTLFHYPIPYIFYRITKRKFPLYELVYGSFLVDLEVPILFLLGVYPSRLVLHSFLGAILFSIPIAIVTYPIVSRFLKLLDINVPHKPKSYSAIVIGALSHVFLDLFNHNYNPLFWPLNHRYVIDLILFNNLFTANIVMQTLMITTTLGIFTLYFKKERNLKKALELMLTDKIQ